MHISQNPGTTQRLLYSLELSFYRNQLAAVGIFVLVFGTILCFRQGHLGILFILLILPLLLYYLYRICRIFHRRSSYIFRTVNLVQPHHHFFTGNMRFSVTFEDAQGNRKTRDTQPIFLVRGIVGPLMEDYVNQTVTVAYNPLTDTLVVIG